MASSQRELRRQLQGLMAFRVVIISTLLACTFVIELLYRPRLSLKSFYLLAICTYLLTIAYAVMARRARAGRPQVYAQLVGDLGIVTGFVYLTGGADSPFSFLYLISIIVGSLLLVRRGGFILAASSWVMYAALVLLIHSEVLPVHPVGTFAERGELATVRLIYLLVAHMVSFFAVAYLASYLTETLRRTGQELEMRRDDLAQLRAFNDDIIDSMNSGLITTDWDGRITFANRSAGEIIGTTIGELTGRSIVGLLGQVAQFLGRIRKALEIERRYRFEFDYERPGGRTLFMGCTVSILRERRGTPLGMVFIFQDLTEIRVLEEEVALKKRMAALGGMAAGVAHELRNPLAAISGSVQVLKRDLKPEGEAGQLMDIVITESQRLDTIIRDFLLFAKPGRFDPRPGDAVILVRETLKLLENSHEKRPDHEVIMQTDSDSIPIMADLDRLKQVFWNLAKNALRAMPDGGSLTVKIADGIEGHTVISFSDTGIGMSEQEIGHNFQPFHGSFESGTGLGLAIVYRIMEEHGGRVRIRSRQGVGTEVSLHIPHRAAPDEQREGRRWTAS